MNKIWAIFKKELRLYFVSPIAYAVLTAFTLIAGIFFYIYLFEFVKQCLRLDMQAQMYGSLMKIPAMNVDEWVVRPFFGMINVILLFILPGITMRIFSEEKRQETMALLLTSPLSDLQIVLGKFLGAYSFYCLMIGITFFHFIFLFVFGEVGWISLLSGYFGLSLVGASFIATGMLVSNYTENQIVAFIVTLLINLMFWLAGAAGSLAGPPFEAVFNYIAFTQHFEDLAKGVIDSKSIVYFVSLIFAGLYLTIKSLELSRSR